MTRRPPPPRRRYSRAGALRNAAVALGVAAGAVAVARSVAWKAPEADPGRLPPTSTSEEPVGRAGYVHERSTMPPRTVPASVTVEHHGGRTTTYSWPQPNGTTRVVTTMQTAERPSREYIVSDTTQPPATTEPEVTTPWPTTPAPPSTMSGTPPADDSDGASATSTTSVSIDVEISIPPLSGTTAPESGSASPATG